MALPRRSAVVAMSAADRRLDELRARRASRTAERAAFEERRAYGLNARHRAKLAWLAARTKTTQTEKENPTSPDTSTHPEPKQNPKENPDKKPGENPNEKQEVA
jgi:hypothetical protein